MEEDVSINKQALLLCVETFDRMLSNDQNWTQQILSNTSFPENVLNASTPSEEIQKLGKHLENIVFEVLIHARVHLNDIKTETIDTIREETENVVQTTDDTSGSDKRVLEQSTLPALTADCGTVVPNDA